MPRLLSRRVSKRMRALVATRTPVLDELLWRTPYSLEALQAAHKADNAFMPQLHPILKAITFRGGDIYDEIKVGSWPRLSSLATNAQICEENASFPPTRGVYFHSYVDHSCQKKDRKFFSCEDCSWGGLVDGEAVTVEEFVKSFLESFSTGCPAFHAAIKGREFLGWERESLDAEAGDVKFEDPEWEP